jgi:LPS export ABC transporter protein LptC
MAESRVRHDLGWTVGLMMAMCLMVWGAGQMLNRQSTARPSGLPSGGSMPGQTAHEEADVVIDGFTFIHAPSAPEAWPVWELTAETATLFEERREALLRTIQATFSPNRGEVAAVLTGETGRFDLDRMDFEVTGSMVPLSLNVRQGYQLRTSQLHWKNADGLLETDRPVEVEGRGLHVKGTGLRWSPATQRAEVLHDVQTVVGSE